MRTTGTAPVRQTARLARPVGNLEDAGELFAAIGPARYVLLGEATHGTREFYRDRAGVTRRLIEEGGLTAVLAEADWPAAYRLNRYVRGHGPAEAPEEALSEFRRFPQWMWRNPEIVALLRWMRAFNDSRPATSRVGFYGLDLYSLHASIEAVLATLARVDPGAARRARERYGCFELFPGEEDAYGYAASLGVSRTCEAEVVAQLLDLERQAVERLRRDGMETEDEEFCLLQNARVVRSAEAY